MEFYFLQLPSYISLGICGLVGILFLYIHIKKIIIDIKISNILILLSLSSIIVQVLIVVLFQSMGNEIGSFSMFYNVINLFILTFLYIYRNEMKLNYYLYWSFALLFLMGMEIRALQTLKLGLLDAI
jgi:hypothetical protein|tara:strand:- start:46 stop:426 length:381 start_codon:yes stop_codon:yes gene_type:complete